MVLNQIPTDNLYIFLTVSGISLLLFSLSFFLKKREGLTTSIHNEGIEIAALEAEVNIISENFKHLNKTFEIKKAQFENRYGVVFIENIENKSTNEEKLDISEVLKAIDRTAHESFIKEYTELINMLHDFSIELKKIQGKSKIMGLNRDEISRQNKELKMYFWVLVVCIITSMLMITWGFSAWYIKHQVFQDVLLQKQVLEGLK